MSDVFYPLSLIEKLHSETFERTVVDPFEDGSSSSRRIWAAQYFKRRYTLTHAPLTAAEWRYLRSFYVQRNGQYDSFWFRDNVHREGNAKVRFASALPKDFQGAARRLSFPMEEVAALRVLPENEELVTAAGSTPILWFDANRELYYEHAGSVYKPDAFAYDSVLAFPAPWQGGTSLPLGGTTSQYQHYAFTNSQWGRTSSIAALTGAQPAATVFAIAKHGTVSSKQVVFGVGAMGAGGALGLAVSASNAYEPWIGGSETWGTATQSNGTNNTWRSFGITWAASSNTANFYVNGAAALTEAETRNYSTGPLTLGAAVDGTLKCDGNVAHVMVFAAQLTHNQIKAVHNLLGYQYGLSIVA